MKLQIRELENGKIRLTGWANIANQDSKILTDSDGSQFREQVTNEAWEEAIRENDDIKLLINHDWNKVVDSTKENLRLTVDTVGLRYDVETDCDELIRAAKSNKLTGTSFGFRSLKSDTETCRDGIPRIIQDKIRVSEISILIAPKQPAYNTKVECRDGENIEYEVRDSKSDIQVDIKDTEQEEKREEVSQLELDKYKAFITIQKLKADM